MTQKSRIWSANITKMMNRRKNKINSSHDFQNSFNNQTSINIQNANNLCEIISQFEINSN